MSTPLPRSLDPLPDESLPGYLLRLAHRLDLSPARLAAITGLAPTKSAAIPAGRMLALQPDMADTFADSTRLSTGEVHALTLTDLAGRYPPLDLRFSGRQRVTHGLFVKENWVYSRSTRYCPGCLAGDGSLIQQRHGGAWSKLWRLPVVFACPTHQRLLRHTCPACQTPVHHRAASGAQLLPLPTDSTLHPTACRNLAAAPSRAGPPPCGHRLDVPTTPQLADHQHHDEQLLRLQQRLLDLLHPHGPATTLSVGLPATPARYFVDLRILTCLIIASWPAARHLTSQASQATLLAQHARDTAIQIDAVRRRGRAVHELAFYDRPPLRADACAALLTLADQITASGDPDTARHLLRPLVTAAPFTRPWTKQFLTGDGYCSPGLQTAIGPEVGATHLIKRTGLPPRPPPRPVRFGVHHIPAYALPDWREQHFTEFTGITGHLIGRAISVRLAQISAGGPATDAGTLLGLPRTAAHYAVTAVHRQLGTTRRRAAFNAAIDALAHDLDTTPSLTDYRRRRDALRHWAITPTQWRDLIAGLPEQLINGRVRPSTHWGDGKRALATVWIWVHITRGEHIFAPAVRPDPQQRRPGGHHVRYIHTRWPFIATTKSGHYTELRRRLDILADQLTNDIDL